MSRFNKAAIYKVFLLFLSGVLAISGVSALVLPAAAQTGQQSVLSTCTLLYAVQPGDTLASISKTFNTTDVSIMGMNAFLSQPGSANGNTSGSTSTGSTSAVTGTNTTTVTGTTSSTAGSNAQNSANVRLILGVVLCLSNDANVGLPVTGASGQNNGSSNSSTSGATGSTTSTVTSTATTTGTNSASTGQNNQAGAGGYAACTLLYAVQKGDTLANIAKKFNATDATITEANINAMNPFLGNNANGSNNSSSSSNANNNNALMPGLVLCLSNTSGVALPNTGSTSGSSSQGSSSGSSSQGGTSGSSQLPSTGQQGQNAQGNTNNQGTMMAMGDVGIYSPFSLDQNSLSVEKVEASKAPWSPLRFEMPLVRIDSTQQNLPTAMTYVFFNVPTHLVKQMGEALSIWYRQNNGDWQRCNTTFIVNRAAFNRATSQSGSNASGVTSGNVTGNSLDNGRTRVACVAPLYNTIYGIGSIMEK